MEEDDLFLEEEDEQPNFYVDIPDPYSRDFSPWVNMRIFDSRNEALEYVKEAFGADEEGRINLITEG